MIYQLIYISSAKELMGISELTELLAQARNRNKLLEITGMLLYSEITVNNKREGKFTQILEGPKDSIYQVFSSIKQDSRHYHIEVLLENDKISRDFSDWSMGFKSLEPEDFNNDSGFFDFNRDITVDEFQDRSKKAIKLMKIFYDNLYMRKRNAK